MTRRYDVRTGMLEHDPDAGQPREQLVPGWCVPGSTRYDYDLRIGDAERDAAFAALEAAFDARDVNLIFLPLDPKWDRLRSDPRFADLIERCAFVSSDSRMPRLRAVSG